MARCSPTLGIASRGWTRTRRIDTALPPRSKLIELRRGPRVLDILLDYSIFPDYSPPTASRGPPHTHTSPHLAGRRLDPGFDSADLPSTSPPLSNTQTVLTPSTPLRRLDPGFDSAASAGFRNLAVNLRVATGETAALGLETHVCEVQLILLRFAAIQASAPHCAPLRARGGCGRLP